MTASWLFRAVLDAYIALVGAYLLVDALWPWDWLGRRRKIMIRRDRRPFE